MSQHLFDVHFFKSFLSIVQSKSKTLQTGILTGKKEEFWLRGISVSPA